MQTWAHFQVTSKPALEPPLKSPRSGPWPFLRPWRESPPMRILSTSRFMWFHFVGGSSSVVVIWFSLGYTLRLTPSNDGTGDRFYRPRRTLWCRCTHTLTRRLVARRRRPLGCTAKQKQTSSSVYSLSLSLSLSLSAWLTANSRRFDFPSIESFRVLPSFTGFYWVLLGFTGFYWFFFEF